MSLCESCGESIKHDDGWTCDVCRLSSHDACDDPHRDDSGTYCDSCWTKMVNAEMDYFRARHPEIAS